MFTIEKYRQARRVTLAYILFSRENSDHDEIHFWRIRLESIRRRAIRYRGIKLQRELGIFANSTGRSAAIA